jgi:hypothetical protein
LKEVRTEIEIGASPEKIWKILTDFDKYDQWNPFIHKVVGQPKEGSRIEIHIETPNGKKRKYEPIVTKVEHGRELRWIGKSSVPGFMHGEHVFMIERLKPERIRFIQLEVFDGLLSSLFGRSLDTDIKHGLNEMNKALKDRAERTSLL